MKNIEGIKRCENDIADFGVSVDLKLCPDFNANAQLNLINQALEEGANAIAIVPINNPIICSRLNELHEQHYPVVLLTNILEHTEYLSFVGCDYTMAGKITAGLLNMIKPDWGKLLLFSPNLQMLGHVLRAEGLKKELDENYPQINLQDVIEMTGDDIKDYQITKEAFASFPDTDLFVCPGAYSRGNLQAIRDLGCFKKAKIICYDFSAELGVDIENRNITATITQCPQEQGYTAVKILFGFLTAGKVPKLKNNYIRTRIILKENLSETESIPERYNPLYK